MDRVIPMLPKELSNGICSLNENQDRFTISVIMKIDEKGKVIDSDIFKSIIKTTRRMNYHDVNDIFQYVDLQNNVKKTLADVVQIVNNMSETFEGRYPTLDANLLVLQNILPYDFPVRKTEKSYDFSNRFGGKVFFYNAYNTVAEREENSEILGAYIILFTRLTKKECKKLAQIDWRRKMPNFLGVFENK